MNANAEWRPIERTGGKYEVSRCGLVRRVGSISPLTPEVTVSGYERVQLWMNGSRDRQLVHVLVAEVFISARPDKADCNHCDGNKRNNNVENLEWVSRSENTLHAFRIGLHKPLLGSANHLTRLSTEQVEGIRRQRASGKTCVAVAKEFGITRNYVLMLSKREMRKSC